VQDAATLTREVMNISICGRHSQQNACHQRCISHAGSKGVPPSFRATAARVERIRDWGYAVGRSPGSASTGSALEDRDTMTSWSITDEGMISVWSTAVVHQECVMVA
jgi:hypothetical protein